MDLSGQRFGKLTAIEPTGARTAHRSVVWRCVCDCGNEVEVGSNTLVTGNTRSCGCIRNGHIGGGIGGGKPRDITGQRFGRLVAVKRVGADGDRQSLWLMKCDCGCECVKSLHHLTSGMVTSCGCRFKPYNHAHERLYHVYHGMKSRCYNKRNEAYKWYGGKGVKVCQEWLDDYNVFETWAFANGYDETAPRGVCTLDRIDPYGNYEPANCRWISIAEQQRNKRQA